MSPDVLIVGGGIAGASAAAHLAADGTRVLLLEREQGPADKVCGEFVSGEAWRDLEALSGGSRELKELNAEPIERVVLVGARGSSEAALPFRGCGLSRRALDDWLLRQAVARGANIRRGTTARTIEAAKGSAVVTLAGGERIGGTRVVLATGKHAMRGHPRHAAAETLIGLKMHLEVTDATRRALARTVELIMFHGGYAGLQLVEAGRANLCMLIEKEGYAALGRDWRRLVAAVPHLAERLAGARPYWQRPLAIAGLTYGYLHPARADESLYRVGDQLAVAPSFTGDGMAMALRSGALVARALQAGTSVPHFHAAATAEFRRPMRIARFVAALGRHAWLQPPLVAMCYGAPGLMAMIAQATRIRDASA